MNNRDVVDQLYVRLINAPDGLDCSINQVLAALGMMASAVLREGFSDQVVRQNKVDWLCRGLQVCVTKSMQQRPTLN